MKVKKQKIISYLLVLFLILNGGTIIKVLDFSSEFQFGTMLLFLTLLIVSGKFNYKKIFTSVFIFSSLFIIISSIQLIRFNNLGGIFSNQIFNFLITIVIAVIISVYFNKRKADFYESLNNILMILIIQGILSSLILTLFPTSSVQFTGINDESISPYVGYGFVFFQRMHLSYLDILGRGTFNIFDIEIFRAHGIFWEPGVFAIYVNIFIFLNLSIFRKRANLILGFIAIFLSWSTAGITVLVIQLVYFSLLSFKFNIRSLLKAFFGTIAIVLVVWVTILNMDDKIYGENSGSSAQRYADTMAAVEIIKKFPIIGIGVDFELFNEQLTKAIPDTNTMIGDQLDMEKVNSNGFSNSLLRVFVYFGLPIGMLLLLSFFKQNLIVKNKGLFAIINLIGVSASPILFLPFHMTFIINGLMNQFGLFKTSSNILVGKLEGRKRIFKNDVLPPHG